MKTSVLNFGKVRSKVREAYLFACKAHTGQKRKRSMQDYIIHPIEVHNCLKQFTDDEDILAAALLHDTVEDCDVTFEDIYNKFGGRVAALVGEVTDPMNIRTKGGLMIKLADILHNISDRKATDMYVKKKIRLHFPKG